jgi:uncharacterized protein (TIGR03083 family)
MDPRRAELHHSTAIQLASTEYQRCVELFRSLAPGDWSRPTDCPDWDVRAMAGHMLGMLEMAASIRENVRQQRASMRAGGDPLEALTALQVRERRTWTPAEIVERFALRAPKAVAGRRRVPAFLRGRRLPGNQRVNGADEPWTVGYLSDIILTRDPWMHRIDISRATGRPLHLTADHDGVIVADVVAEWAARHGKDFTLTLDGPAGGTWTVGANGPALKFETIEFCRCLSGRPGSVSLDDLFATEVPY